ncbi:unnamed protein product [Effrenium voratum]|nr:unnamed protein product [Effrenium voratum]
MEIPWRGRLVETPYGWGVCVKEAENQLEVDLDWRLEHGRAKCWTRPDQLRRSSFCALGTCVQTSFGPGVLLQYRREDDVHEVQLWGPLSQRHRAYLRRDALKRVIPAMPGLAVETPQGPGICKAVSGDSLSIAWPWGRGELRSDEVTCPAAKTLPLVSRFLDAAVQLVRLHSGTLLRLAEALNGVGLEQLQEQLAAKAGEAVNTAMNLWEDWEAKEDQEVAKELHSQVEQAMPELQGVVGGLVSGLNQLLCRVQGFDGTWVGQADGEARCVIKDAVLVWHWGQDSELEIWSPESISTLLEGEIFRGKKLANGSLEWSDGDVWVRTDGPAEEESEVDLPQLNESLQSLRQMVTGAMPADLSEVDLEERLQEAMKCVKDIATTASADEEVKKLASTLESEMEHCQDQLSFIQQELLESKAGSVLLEGRRRLSVQLAELQETAITPQLDAMQQRSKRFLTRLATDKKVGLIGRGHLATNEGFLVTDVHGSRVADDHLTMDRM